MILIIILILLIIFYVVYTKYNVSDKYENTFGYSRKNIEKIMYNTSSDPFIQAEIMNFNMGDTTAADKLYEEALQLAIYNSLEINPERVLDRIIPEKYIMPAARMEQTDEEYYNREIRADPQNVHDSNVRSELNEKYQNLMKIVDISHFNLNNLKMHSSARALIVIDNIMKNPAYMEIIDDTDHGVLTMVAARAETINEIYPALSCALENCISDDMEIVCTTGRISNILDSLTHVDPVLGAPVVTIEILRKDILQDTLNYLNTIDDMRRENDITNVANEIEELIKKKYTADINILNKLIQEAQMGI